MRYHYRVSQHRQRRHLRRIYVFFIIIAVIIGLIVLAIRLDSFLQNRLNTDDSTTSGRTSAYFASSNKIFTTDYFQFQAPKNWAEIPSESTDEKFVYRGMNKSIVEDELIIYINHIPGNLTATRLLPVKKVAGGKELSPGDIAGHCNKASKSHNIDEKVVDFKGVSINCDIDNTQFNVLVGLSGGSTLMELKRPDGSSVNYSILYRNVEAVPDASDLIQIVQSFQTR